MRVPLAVCETPALTVGISVVSVGTRVCNLFRLLVVGTLGEGRNVGVGLGSVTIPDPSVPIVGDGSRVGTEAPVMSVPNIARDNSDANKVLSQSVRK